MDTVHHFAIAYVDMKEKKEYTNFDFGFFKGGIRDVSGFLGDLDHI